MLESRYFNRLGFSEQEGEALRVPSRENLATIVEAHLQRVTFDNLSQHGLPFTASLDRKKTAQKILDEKRGGFCFELNGLLSELLLELGYPVKRLPAIVHAGSDVGFRGMPTHMILIVTASENEWLVDVGFGEPAIHPLKYELNIEQWTPDGMVSRIIKCADSNVDAILEWKKDETWSPRLKFQWEHPGQDLAAFQNGLDYTLSKTSIFYQKLIVCKINRNEKVSLAGTRLKRTAPRFGLDSKVEIKELGCEEEVKRILEKEFGVLDAAPLDLSKSKTADPEVWTQL